METFTFDHDLTLYNLGDVHRASANCDVKLLHKIIKTIADDPFAYWVSTGDLLEVALRSSKSSCYEADNPEQELDDLARELEPIKNKCLGFVASNHHERVQKDCGFSLDRVLSDRAGLPYLGISAIIKIVCGRCAYYVALHHGTGTGGGTDGNKANRAILLAQNFVGVDIWMSGHSHSYFTKPTISTVLDRKRDKVTDIITHHIVTAHFLDWPRSYAEKWGLKKSLKGVAYAKLKANGSGQEGNKKVKPGLWCG